MDRVIILDNLGDRNHVIRPITMYKRLYKCVFENHYMHTSQFHQPTSQAAQFCQFVGKNNILDLDLDLEPFDLKILRIQTHNAGLPALVTNCQIFCRLTAIAVAGWR